LQILSTIFFSVPQKERNMLKYGRYIIAALVVLAIGLSVYAFAASNTVPNVTAGEGAGAVTGFTTGAPTYTLSSGDVTQVVFTLTGTMNADQVTLHLVTSSASWYSCTLVNTSATVTTATCTIAPGLDVTTIDEFRVVAVGS